MRIHHRYNQNNIFAINSNENRTLNEIHTMHQCGAAREEFSDCRFSPLPYTVRQTAISKTQCHDRSLCQHETSHHRPLALPIPLCKLNPGANFIAPATLLFRFRKRTQTLSDNQISSISGNVLRKWSKDNGFQNGE